MINLRSVSFDTSRTDLRPLPIDPTWIKEGNPVARSVTVGRSSDSLLSTGLWDCTAGKFTWIFRRDEIAHIVEGEVRVHDGETTHVLVPGSVAYFPRGLTTVWEVPTYVKKAFVLRAAPPSLVDRLTLLWRQRPAAGIGLVAIGLIVASALAVVSGAAPSPQLALEIADFAELPVTGLPDGTDNNAGSLARINVMREEPAPRHRLFVNDLTGPLYILDRQTHKATPYLDFNGRGDRAGLFDKLTTDAGLASGFISFEFDPDYANNGRFYTIHLEELALPGALVPDARGVPGLDLADYLPTAPVQVPGTSDHEGVLIEWTDSNLANTTFEGTARELLRIRLNSRIHPLGDMTFNPSARPGDADWRVMYVACGDGGSGDQFRSNIRLNPQRLDTLVGKVLRIIPDLAAHTTDSVVSENGRYRIPTDNPFAAVAGARPEVWAYGLRNPHRLSWDVAAKGPSRPRLIATVIGWRTWETVVFVRKGANYGYPLREGDQRIEDGRLFDDLPRPDEVSVLIDGSQTTGNVKPTYPVLQYGHSQASGGDAIAGGFVYRGRKVSRLLGKFVFGDISTGRLWHSDVSAMVAADDAVAQTLAPTHELSVWWDDPHDFPDRGKQRYATMAPIVQAAYHARGGKDPDLPGTGTISGSGRVDLRFAIDRAGELYLLSKSDGTIRVVTGARRD